MFSHKQTICYGHQIISQFILFIIPSCFNASYVKLFGQLIITDDVLQVCICKACKQFMYVDICVKLCK